MDDITRAALWGLIGGFMYAGPRFYACVYASRHGGDCSPGLCALEFLMGVLTGAAASASLAPAILAQGFSWLGTPGPHQLPAVGGAVGYAFHRLGPAVLDGAVKRAATLIGKAAK